MQIMDKVWVVMAILVLIPVGLITAAKPQSWWWITKSWQYRDPEANEPSSEGYLLLRFSGFVALGVAVVLIAVLADPV